MVKRTEERRKRKEKSKGKGEGMTIRMNEIIKTEKEEKKQ